MTDLEKWKILLDSMNIKYNETDDRDTIFDRNYKLLASIPIIKLEIDRTHLKGNKRGYRGLLEITFFKDGSFDRFNTRN